MLRIPGHYSTLRRITLRSQGNEADLVFDLVAYLRAATAISPPR